LKEYVGTADDNTSSPNYGKVVEPEYAMEDGVQVVKKGTKTKRFKMLNDGMYAPTLWTTKIWRTAYASGTNSWGTQMWAPVIIYGKRYSNVLLDYAECCFRTNDEAEGWRQLDILRNRAWGNLTVGQDYSKYFGHYNNVYNAYPWQGSSYTPADMTEYPVGVLTATVTVPSAKEYYTKLQATPNRVGYSHTSEVWKVAVNEERRKEFNCEWCLRPDMQKSGYMADHVAHNYPKRDVENLKDVPWTNRAYDYNDLKMDMPIPQDELIKNPLCDQNPAYLGN
jgi:hypothetical protein